MDLFPTKTGSFPEPREFQRAAHEKLREGFRQGKRRQILVAPTGSGKTYIAMRLVNECLKLGKRAIFVCDRNALINQTSAVADQYGLTDHAIVQAGHQRRDNACPFQIVSLHTVASRNYWPPADLIIIDECHSIYEAWADHCKNTSAAVIGLTATPFTKGLGLLFDGIVNASTMDELTRQEVLVPMRILTCVTPDMKGAKTKNGEWTPGSASERELTILGDVIAEWVKHGENRKTIAFGPDVSYVNELVRRFNEVGVGAAAWTYNTPASERAELLREFQKPDPAIKILASVAALAKGFDVKDISCVIDAKPLRKSLSEVIQMWGRGLRASPETGKQNCILLDHSGNVQRFYDDFVDVYFNGCGTLNTAEKYDETIRKDSDEKFEPTGCPSCHHKPFKRICLACGYEKQTQALVDSMPAVMEEIMIGKKKAAKNSEDLLAQLCTYARHYLKSEKKAGWVFFKYRDIVGQKPPRSWNFDSTPDTNISSATMGKIKSMQIAFRKSKER